MAGLGYYPSLQETGGGVYYGDLEREQRPELDILIDFDRDGEIGEEPLRFVLQQNGVGMDAVQAVIDTIGGSLDEERA